ncbi:hypothetical protein [Nibribacter koreensis]
MTIPIIIAIVAFLLAGFTFFKVSGLLHRISSLEKKNRELESGLKGLENNFKRNNPRNPQQESRPERGNQPKQPQQAQPARGQQPAPEQRQKQQPQQNARQQAPQPQQPPQERQPKQAQPQLQRAPQEPRARQEGQPPQQQQRQPREPRQPQEGRQPRNPQQGQQPAQPLDGDLGQQPTRVQQQQPQQRRNEPRRRDGMNPQDQNPQSDENRAMQNPMLGGGMVGDDLLNELSQPQQAPQEPESPIRFAIIPEDGVIKTHQLQRRPDSDSYLEIDTPQEGSTQTRYRFNLAGNHAFVISQGMDRLENAFNFEKPSNRMVTRIVQQGDGVLTRTGSGWKIQEKARIDFS